MNENGPGIAEVFSMFIPMHIAAIEMLSEHNLINETPSPRAFNASIVTVLLIDFLKDTANDFDIEDVCEIVRAVDKAGLKLVPRKEVVGCNSEDIELLRAAYKEKEDEYEGEAYPERDWKEEVSHWCVLEIRNMILMFMIVHEVQEKSRWGETLRSHQEGVQGGIYKDAII